MRTAWRKASPAPASARTATRAALLAASPELGKGNLLYALELLHNDGPFTHPDDYQKVNGVLRYSEGYANNGFSVTAMAYRGKWNATDQIPQRAVDAGALGRFDAIDPTDGGARTATACRASGAAPTATPRPRSAPT